MPGCLRCSAGPGPRCAGICGTCWSCSRPASRWAAGCPLCHRPACGCGEGAAPPWTWLEAALDYSGAVREIILLYKFGPEGGRPLLARPLGQLLAAHARASGILRGVQMVTAVPSHAARIRQRGFDAALALARALSRQSGLRFPSHLLRRSGAGAPRSRRHSGISGQQRFQARPGLAAAIAGQTVLLVDDVHTTGSTLSECATILAAAGPAEVRALVLARTPRRKHLVL